MSRIRIRYKVLTWVALAIAGILIAFVAGPMYASYYWPKELNPNSVVANGFADFDAMVRSIEKAKPIAETANMLTSIGWLITAVASIGLAFTLCMHYRKRKRMQVNPSGKETRFVQEAK